MVIKTFISLTIALSLLSEASTAQTINQNKLLDARQQSIVVIAALTANGDQNHLAPALQKGLDAGLTVAEIKEIMIQLYAYAGFPRSLNALTTFMSVLNERKQKGISDAAGKEPHAVTTEKSSYELGIDVQTKLLGAPATSAVFDFAPTIDKYLKAHLFGDIFSRDNLDWQTRELATVSALASIAGVENQLTAHIRLLKKLGITDAQMNNLISTLKTEVGQHEAQRVSIILNQTNAPTTTAFHDKEIAGSQQNADTVFAKGKKIISNNFKGNAWLQSLVDKDTIYFTQVGNVTFEAGARTNWHFHTGGQILLAIGGTGYYQERGSQKRILRKGDVIKCPPNVPHWHGAAPNEEFIQLAVTPQQNGTTVWLEPVTDEEYSSKINDDKKSDH